MHQIMIRFKDIRNDRILELALDMRLSFKENMEMLKDFITYNCDELRIYDPQRKIFLDRNVPLEYYSFQSFMTFYLFL